MYFQHRQTVLKGLSKQPFHGGANPNYPTLQNTLNPGQQGVSNVQKQLIQFQQQQPKHPDCQKEYVTWALRCLSPCPGRVQKTYTVLPKYCKHPSSIRSSQQNNLNTFRVTTEFLAAQAIANPCVTSQQDLCSSSQTRPCLAPVKSLSVCNNGIILPLYCSPRHHSPSCQN